ncbi:Extracellular dipeptidyl-peptidase dpp4 [Apiospora sp. TS-2023a]
MHSSTVFLPITALLASTAYGAECYAQNGATACLTRAELNSARADYCGNNNYQLCGAKTYTGQYGKASFAGVNVGTQQECWDETIDIINQCFGKKNGGSFSSGSGNVNINFCL